MSDPSTIENHIKSSAMKSKKSKMTSKQRRKLGASGFKVSNHESPVKSGQQSKTNLNKNKNER